jgi:hypothetical protein
MGHPEINSLVAFIEGTLEPGKRAEVEAHLKGCQNCKSEIAALAAKLAEPEPTAGPEPTVVARKKPNSLTWVISIAAVLILGLALVFFLRSRESQKTTLTATESSPSNASDPYLTSSGVKKKVEGKTFRLTEKIWVDEDYKPSAGSSIMEFQKNTQAYKDLIAAKPTLKPFAEAGSNVIVLFENQAYKFTP